MPTDSPLLPATGKPTLAGTSLTASCIAFFSALCCILPTAFLVAGMGGAWLAVFGKIAAISLYIVAASVVLIAVAWILALRRQSSSRVRIMLVAASAITAFAWILILREAALNDALISMM